MSEYLPSCIPAQYSDMVYGIGIWKLQSSNACMSWLNEM